MTSIWSVAMKETLMAMMSQGDDISVIAEALNRSEHACHCQYYAMLRGVGVPMGDTPLAVRCVELVNQARMDRGWSPLGMANPLEKEIREKTKLQDEVNRLKADLAQVQEKTKLQDEVRRLKVELVESLDKRAVQWMKMVAKEDPDIHEAVERFLCGLPPQFAPMLKEFREAEPQIKRHKPEEDAVDNR